MPNHLLKFFKYSFFQPFPKKWEQSPKKFENKPTIEQWFSDTLRDLVPFVQVKEREKHP